MKEYRFKNATIYVHGNVSKQRLKNATIRFAKQSQKYKMLKQEVKNT